MTAPLNYTQIEILQAVCHRTGQKLDKLSQRQIQAYLALFYDAPDRKNVYSVNGSVSLASFALNTAERHEYLKALSSDANIARETLNRLRRLESCIKPIMDACLKATGGKP